MNVRAIRDRLEFLATLFDPDAVGIGKGITGMESKERSKGALLEKFVAIGEGHRAPSVTGHQRTSRGVDDRLVPKYSIKLVPHLKKKPVGVNQKFGGQSVGGIVTVSKEEMRRYNTTRGAARYYARLSDWSGNIRPS